MIENSFVRTYKFFTFTFYPHDKFRLEVQFSIFAILQRKRKFTCLNDF